MKQIFQSILCSVALVVPFYSQADPQSIKLSFVMEDTVKMCQALVLDEAGKPAAEVSVNFFVKRFFGLLPVGEAASTDANGMARVNFPLTIPEDDKGGVSIIASLDDDEDIKSEAVSTWGIKRKTDDATNQKALWASRSNVPTYLMLATNFTIIVIWGTMFYLIYQLFFRLRKFSDEPNSY